MPDKLPHIVDFLISKSFSRAAVHAAPIPRDCAESVQIFDELDSLSAEEFAIIYATYLIGTNEEREWEHAHRRALASGFESLELMVFDEKLHLALGAARRLG